MSWNPFKISDDPLFIEKVRDIVGLYLHPPDHAVVLSFDEKPQIQALERAQPILPMDLGRPERQTHNYIRHGTVDLFAALNVATGQVVAQTKKQHRSRDFVSFLREIDERVDSALTVHVILDGSGLASELRAQGDFLSVAACEVRPEARKPVTHVHGP